MSWKENWEEADELCDEIVEMIDSEIDDEKKEGPAADFFESVREKAAAIQETVTRTRRATEGQITALENMKAGVESWLD